MSERYFDPRLQNLREHKGAGKGVLLIEEYSSFDNPTLARVHNLFSSNGIVLSKQGRNMPILEMSEALKSKGFAVDVEGKTLIIALPEEGSDSSVTLRGSVSSIYGAYFKWEKIEKVGKK